MTPERPDPIGPADEPDAPAAEQFERLGLLLDRAVRALGAAGEPDAASRIAAEGWWIVREPSPRAGRRLNAALHYLALSLAPKSMEPNSERREENDCNS